MNLSILMLSKGIGFCGTNTDASHFCNEDYNLIRLCPGIEYISVSDETIALAAGEYALCQTGSPIYIATDVVCTGTVESEELPDMKRGFRYIKNTESKDVLLIVQGFMAHIAAETKFGKTPSIIEIFKCPYNISGLLKEISAYRKVIVAEERQLSGGLGSEILELLHNHNINIPLKLMGIDYGNKFSDVSGSREYWLEKYGISSQHLAKAVKGDL